MAYSVCISVCICISVCMFKVSVYNCLAWGVSQYFKLCQGALKSIVNISLQCLYKQDPIYLKRVWRKSFTSEHSGKNSQSTEKEQWLFLDELEVHLPQSLMVAKNGGLQKRSSKERVYLILPHVLYYPPVTCLRSKTNFRAFSSLKLPSCSLNSFTVRDVEVGFGRLKAVRVESLRFICCETTKV